MDLSGLTIEESFARLDLEIFHLEERLHQLRSLRNTLPPISSLPNEILAKIFFISHHHDTETDSDGTVEGDTKRKPRGAMRLAISWVSQRWRVVALSYPDLWTFVAKGSLDYIQACLDRSHGLQLRVNLLSPHGKHIETAFRTLDRVRSIDISFDAIPPSTENININGVWDQPAPHLVSLKLKRFHLPASDPGIQQSRTLFSSVHPRLRRLILSDCDYQWQSPLISTSASTLTTLHVINPKWLVYAEVLVDVLRVMTSLVHCKLVRCLVAPRHGPDPEIGRTVYLPNLRTFTLHQTNASDPFTVLSRLNLPNATIDIQSQLPTIASGPYTTILQHFEDYWSQTDYWKNIDIRHISMHVSNLTISTITPTAPEHSQSTRHFTMAIRANCFPQNIASSIQRLLSLPQCNLESAFLQYVSSSMVHDHFARFTNLRVLQLNNINLVHSVDDEGSGHDAFPALEDLEIDDVHYSSFADYWGQSELSAISAALALNPT